jgi:opacity protein-like surface antigen
MKKILVALVMLALVFGSAAALEASLTVDIDTEIISGEKSGTADRVWGGINQAPSGNGSGWLYDDSTVDFKFADDDGRYGAQIQFDIDGAISPTLLPTFANLNAWIMLGDYFKFSAGRITSGLTKRRNAIIDEQHLGPMNGAQKVDHDYRTDQLILTTARDLELMTDFYFGKFFEQDFALTGAVFNTIPSAGSDAGRADFGARFSGTLVPDLLKLNLTYRQIREQNTLSQALSKDGYQYRNNLGLYVEVSPMENLGITAGYGGSIVLFDPKDSATYNTQPIKDFKKSSDMYHGIDVRADFNATETVLIEAQLNVSFGGAVLKATGNSGVAAMDKAIEQGSTYFGIFGALGANIGLTETLSVGIGGTLWIDNTTTVDKFDGSAGTSGNDGKKDAYTTFAVEGTLGYAVSESASAHIGVKYAGQAHKEGGNKVKGDDYSRFSVPVGIKVKF